MKKLYLIIALVFATSAIADEKKTITPKEFATTISEVPSKLGNFISSEVDKTKEYQKKSWAEMSAKWPFTMFKKKEQ